MKRLFVTDMDGTLLDPGQEIPSYTRRIIRKTIENGDYFTVASARTPASALPLLEGSSLNAPAILMNGVLLYDTKKCQTLTAEYIPDDQASQIVELFKLHNRFGFMYHFENELIQVYHRELKTEIDREFRRIRQGNPGRKFVLTDDLTPHIDGHIIYFAVVGRRCELEALSKSISALDHLSFVFYKDVYDTDLYYLEIYSDRANKENGIQVLKRQLGCSEVIVFGDNYNDMGMFRCADRCFAVENSVPELKEIATAVIPSNAEEGVAKALEGFLP